ncbi:MAG: hypothetical protein ACREBS_03255 [Nitrososphaerales archaeon]
MTPSEDNSASSSSFSSASDEAYFQSYSIRVSKMNGWQLALELANRVEGFDRLNDDVERAKINGNSQELKKAEKMRDREERQIEILRDNAR